MRSRLIPTDWRALGVRAWALSWLTFVWILLWGNVSWANVLGGLVVAIAITTLLPLPRVPVEGRLHVFSAIVLTAHLCWYLVQSSAQVAWLSVRPGSPTSAVLRTRLDIKSDLVLSLAVNAINLIPGAVVLEIDQARRIIYVHVLDVGTPEAAGRFYRQVSVLERLFVATFERDCDWRADQQRHQMGESS